MSNRNYLTTIGVIGILATSAPTFANDSDAGVSGDGDGEHTRVLLEQARTFGVPGITGQAAGEIEAQRERRRKEAHALLTDDEKLWIAVLEPTSSGN